MKFKVTFIDSPDVEIEADGFEIYSTDSSASTAAFYKTTEASERNRFRDQTNVAAVSNFVTILTA